MPSKKKKEKIVATKRKKKHHFFVERKREKKNARSKPPAWHLPPLLLQQRKQQQQRHQLQRSAAKVRKVPGTQENRVSERCKSLESDDVLFSVFFSPQPRPRPLSSSSKQKKTVIVWLRPTGDAPILKQQRYKVGADERFSKIVDLLRERTRAESVVSL